MNQPAHRLRRLMASAHHQALRISGVRNTHIYSGVMLILASLWCLLWFIPENTEEATSDLDISPALVPAIAVGTILVLAIVMFVRALRMNAADADELDEEYGAEATGVTPVVMRNMAIWVAVSVISWLLIEYVGFEPAMTLFLLGAMVYVGVKSWWTIGLTSVLTPIVLSQLAFEFFSTQLPGIWR